MERSIHSVLGSKGTIVHSVGPGTPVRDAVHRMNDYGIGCLLVLDGHGMVGIFTERDVLRRVLDRGRDPDRTQVREVMTTPVVTVGPEVRVGDAMRLMTETRHRHLPVVRGGRLLGLVSIGDLTAWVTRDLRSHVEDLNGYVHGPCAHASG